MTETFYDVLGVAADATTEQIEAAYRERLKESHPDLSDDEDAADATKRIVRARDVLTDEAERERYDRIGHAAYVGRTESSVDEDDASSAASAARHAGWARDGSDDASTVDHAGTGSRRRTDERRNRERAARERVDASRSTTSGGGDANGESSTATTDGGAATTDDVGSAAGSGTRGRHRRAAPRDVSQTTQWWNGTDGYNVRQTRGSKSPWSAFVPDADALPLLCIAFTLYPVMLFSALYPPFPLVVNLLVGACVICVVGYLQSVPEVGVLVFGAWSVLTPVLFGAAGVGLATVVGILAVTGTVLPFGLSVLTLTVIRP